MFHSELTGLKNFIIIIITIIVIYRFNTYFYVVRMNLLIRQTIRLFVCSLLLSFLTVSDVLSMDSKLYLRHAEVAFKNAHMELSQARRQRDETTIMLGA